MVSLTDLSRVKRCLLIGAHSDDVEIGCGGLVQRLLDASPQCVLTWVVLSGDDARHAEAAAAARDLVGERGKLDLRLKSFPDRFFPGTHAAIKAYFDQLGHDQPRPDLVLVHARDDRHQDHRVCAELAWNTFRDEPILEYEVPKWDGELPTPNVFVALTDEQAARKCAVLMRHFGTQRSKRWFDEELFRGLMRLRGVECGAKYAEAFVARKLVV